MNQSRVFRRWLEKTFGVDRLRGTGVMDVAGGKGELSFELKTYGHIESLSWIRGLWILSEC